MVRLRNMDSYRDIIYRLRQKQGVRAIQRDTGTHRTVIRQLLKLALEKDWLNPTKPLPSIQQIQECYVAACPEKKGDRKRRILDPFLDQIKEWHSQGYSSTVMHQLLQGRCDCSKSAVQRFYSKNEPIESIIIENQLNRLIIGS